MLRPALLLLCFSAAPVLADSGTRIVVPAISVSAGVEPEVGTVVGELVLEALLNRHGVKALGPQDVRDLLSAEQQKMLLGCDKESCMAELAGALGAGKLVSGLVGKVGTLYVITLKLVDQQSASVAARASKSFPKVEDLPAAIGPLVDELLNAAPRARGPVAALESAPEVKRAPAMDARAFCKRAKGYSEALESSAYAPSMVGERRALLEDLLSTAFVKEYDEKQGCLRSWDGRLISRLVQQVRASKSAEEANDLRRRFYEWKELMRQVDLLEEAYKTGYEKEKNGAGARPRELPFAVTAREVEAPENTPEVRRYLDDYQGAYAAVGALLAAVKAGDRAKFDAAFTPPDPKRSRSSLDSMWGTAAGQLKNGYAVDACPAYTLAAVDVERNAARYAKDGLLQACTRRMKDGSAYTDSIELKNAGGRWLIDRI